MAWKWVSQTKHKLAHKRIYVKKIFFYIKHKWYTLFLSVCVCVYVTTVYEKKNSETQFFFVIPTRGGNGCWLDQIMLKCWEFIHIRIFFSPYTQPWSYFFFLPFDPLLLYIWCRPYIINTSQREREGVFVHFFPYHFTSISYQEMGLILFWFIYHTITNLTEM